MEMLSWRQGTLRRNQLTGSHACVIFKVGIVPDIEKLLKSAVYIEPYELHGVRRLGVAVKSKYL